MISAPPATNSSRLRQTESSLAAPATRSGSRVFHASSAACTFCLAVCSVNGGNGGLGGTGLTYSCGQRHSEPAQEFGEVGVDDGLVMMAEAARGLTPGEAKDRGAYQAFGAADLGLRQAAFTQRGREDRLRRAPAPRPGPGREGRGRPADGSRVLEPGRG